MQNTYQEKLADLEVNNSKKIPSIMSNAFKLFPTNDLDIKAM